MTRVVFVLQEPTPYRTPHLAAFAGLPDFDVTIVYAARTVQQRHWTVPAAGTDVIYLSGPSLPLTKLLHHEYVLTPGVWRLLGQLRPDVVVIGGWSLMATQLAIVWARRHRVPYLLMADNHLLEPRPLWVRAVKRIVLRSVIPAASGWLVPGSLARDHVLHYGAREDGLITFPLTIDVDATAARAEELRVTRQSLRAALGISEETVVVLHVGRLIAQKAVDVLVRAAARVSSDIPLRLLVAGTGPEEDALRDLARKLAVPATFTGFLADDRLLETYVAADIFALVSRRETWGVVVNEASACSLPLILSAAVGAAADLLRPGENGELVPSDDVDATAAAIEKLAGEPDLRRRYGRQSRERMSAWGYERSVSELAQLVKRIAA